MIRTEKCIEHKCSLNRLYVYGLKYIEINNFISTEIALLNSVKCQAINEEKILNKISKHL